MSKETRETRDDTRKRKAKFASSFRYKSRFKHMRNKIEAIWLDGGQNEGMREGKGNCGEHDQSTMMYVYVKLSLLNVFFC